MNHLLVLLLLIPAMCLAQPDTEVYILDLDNTNGNFSLSNPVNISRENPGYDNQPAFLPDGRLLYVATRGGQTDVVRADPATGEREWLTDTPVGGEYSPTPMPEKAAFSAIRLDTTGFQRLYAYDDDTGNSTVLVPDLVIGYHVWLTENQLAVFVLDQPATLRVCQIQSNECRVLAENIGRSLHRIPGTSLFSYIDKSGPEWSVNSMDPDSGETRALIQTLDESEDVTWSAQGILFSGQGSMLYKYDPQSDADWVAVADLSEYGISGITRLAISRQGDKIALVAAR